MKRNINLSPNLWYTFLFWYWFESWENLACKPLSYPPWTTLAGRILPAYSVGVPTHPLCWGLVQKLLTEFDVFLEGWGKR